MHTMIVFFIALFAIPVLQVVIGPRFERPGAPVLIDRSSKIIIALGKHLAVPGYRISDGPKVGAAAEGELT